jgi:hypothetical protein
MVAFSFHSEKSVLFSSHQQASKHMEKQLCLPLFPCHHGGRYETGGRLLFAFIVHRTGGMHAVPVDQIETIDIYRE